MTPWRTGGGPRPTGVPLPPERMPAWRDGRPLKRWRYLGVYGPDVMLCVATARIGIVPIAWWAVWDRASRTLVESTHRGTGGVIVEPGHAAVTEGPVAFDLEWDETAGVETVSPHGASYIWTRKQGGIGVRGTLQVQERSFAIDASGVIDDSAGYHARETVWAWSAGVGVLQTGEAVAWNLVDGVHDFLEASERTVWVDGAPREVGPVRFARDLSSVGPVSADTPGLAFSAEATRARKENLLLLRSAYVQPFGTFSGTLPGGGELAEGYGVMESHDVRW
jgi:hypothetical protein